MPLTKVKLIQDVAEPPESAMTVCRLPGLVRPSTTRTHHDHLRITTIERSDTDAVLAMLERCSAATLYNRFHGVTDGVAYGLQVLANTAGPDAYGAWSADRCVGLATLAVSGDGPAEVGVLVEDSWQRRGAGSALMSTLLDRGRGRGLPSLVADVLAHNQFIVALLDRLGPITTSVASGSYTVHSNLELEHEGRRPHTRSHVGQEGTHADR